jgi:hypothetical protein
MNAVVKTQHGEVRAHKAALGWMGGFLSEHRRRYGSRGRQELQTPVEYQRSGHPELGVRIGRLECSSRPLGPS